jgi:mRNA-degrading endonuclease YafQ of YafQ-DinJ toxin-antitoxin module
MNQLKYELNTTKRVDRKIQKIVKKDKKLDKRLRKVFKQLKQDPFYKGLRTHKVNARNGMWHTVPELLETLD